MGNARAWYVFVAVVVIVFRVCYAQNLAEAANYINNLESQVKEVSQNAVANFMNSCELLASCQGNCSRHACTPVQADEGYECKHVALNTNCHSTDGSVGCQNLRVSMTKSFIRLPTGPNNLTNEANTTICSQRMLDATFKSISSPQNALNLTSWVYFGSVEGVQRNFPGRDLPSDNCTFELRKRPWYIGATSVKKDVIVLLDTGNSMGDKLPSDLLVTAAISKLSASFSIVTELLDTLAYGDRVTVITFTSFGAQTVLPPMTITGNATAVQSLKTALQSNISFDNTQGDSNLTSAFVLANQTFVGTNALKVILTITDGQIMPVTSGTTSNTKTVFDSIRSFNTLVQIFSFDRPPADTGARLQTIACDCFGTYERITTVKNPLWTLRSYFGILARIRLEYNNTPSWTSPYQDSGSLGQIITVIFPAFADNYTLIGVAGIDVLLDELGSITQSDFTTILITHGKTDSIPGLVPPRLPCNFALSTANQCPSVTAPANVLCPNTDTSGLTFTQRVCDCPGVCLASVINRRSSLTPGQIGGIGVGVSVSALLVLALIFLCYRKGRLENEKRTAFAFAEKPSSDSLMSKFKPGSAPLSSWKTPGRSLRANSLGWGSQARQSLTEYTQAELAAATGDWSSDAELGRGAHGLVFKGTLSNGTVVAIKKPTRDVTQDAWDTFATELELLSKLNHKRLVRLLGYCKEEIILVYEFMENGTLADWLHSPNTHAVLGWESRLKIAMGAAKGLEYLHEYAMPKTYHGDVKPANILLDHEWEAHVSDFGLSIWSKDDKNQDYLMASRVGGTFGYLDPEFVSSGQVTFASDVYSFGIVLLELMTGRPVVVEFENIKDWAGKYEDDDALEDVLDKSLEAPEYHVDVLVEIVRIALRCTERKKQDRPKMKEVASSLDQAWNFWVRAQECIPEEPAIEPR
ncbi:hypothetical protein KC19_6G023200 [Ceratodon purpureus]|uniref:Protein kinase domain-containing protein n=1 Tax=Ceratodon purpureus TaxID=3225 RepID=A0A8T0HAP7_CERPU|nr:hypothetical protein KC19_6G023200 [Ceratodon purpureus]